MSTSASVFAPAETLAEVFLGNRAQLRRLAHGIVRSPEAAEDILQDAWIRLSDCERLGAIQRPLCYCCQVVRNLALDHCRRQTLESSYRWYDIEVETIELRAAASPQKSLQDYEVLCAIDRELSKLPERTRHAHELYRIHGLTQRQIAERLDCALGLVNALLADAARAIEGCRNLMYAD